MSHRVSLLDIYASIPGMTLLATPFQTKQDNLHIATTKHHIHVNIISK